MCNNIIKGIVLSEQFGLGKFSSMVAVILACSGHVYKDKLLTYYVITSPEPGQLLLNYVQLIFLVLYILKPLINVINLSN